jgi:hypothetical protein
LPLRPAIGAHPERAPKNEAESFNIVCLLFCSRYNRGQDTIPCQLGKKVDAFGLCKCRPPGKQSRHAQRSRDQYRGRMSQSNDVTYLARTDFRNGQRLFGIKREDRFSHVYIIGKTGTGKSTLMEGMALQDLERGNGFALIDPHGDLVERIADRIPAKRLLDVVYLDAADPTQPYGYNPLRHVRQDRIALAASGMMEVFAKMWPEAWGVRMEHILRNVLMALLEQPSATLHDVLRIITDTKFRKSIAASLKNETVRTFLQKEFDRFTFGYRADGIAPIQNKVGAFLADPLLNRILTAPKQDLHI